MCLAGHFKELLIYRVKGLFALLFMAEYLDHLLAVHHLLHKALCFSYRLLLAYEVSCRAAAHVFNDPKHDCHTRCHHQGHPYTVVQHDSEHRGNHDRRHEKLGNTLGDQLPQRIDIIGIIAHDIAVIVEVFHREILHTVEHLHSQPL